MVLVRVLDEVGGDKLLQCLWLGREVRVDEGVAEELFVDRQLFLMANTLLQNCNLGRTVQYTSS